MCQLLSATLSKSLAEVRFASLVAGAYTISSLSLLPFYSSTESGFFPVVFSVVSDYNIREMWAAMRKRYVFWVKQNNREKNEIIKRIYGG